MQHEVSFEIDQWSNKLALEAAKRAKRLDIGWGSNLMSTHMDLCATHANGCPMDFKRLVEADDFNFIHDVGGIHQHLNRETGELENCFRPRFAAKVTA